MPLITTNSKTFALHANETLLEGLERTGHEVEYQCRSGYCGACRLSLQSGEVSYPSPPLAFLFPNEILPCCCQVDSDLILDCSARQIEPDLFDTELFDQADESVQP